MKMYYRALFIAIAIAFSGYACGEFENPVADVDSSDSKPIAIERLNDPVFLDINSDPIRINNYDLKFNGKTYDENTNRSTFSYNISGTGVEPALNSIFLETPSCAGSVVSLSPTQSAKVSETGIKWEASVTSTGSLDLSVTYAGDLHVGLVDATIESGNQSETKKVPGPCKGIFTISGSIYVDANSNQQKELSEFGIQNVTVHLSNGGGSEYTQITSAFGAYTFTVYAADVATDFNLEVREETNDTTDFNEQLFDAYTSTTLPPELTVTVDNADVNGADFGFSPQTQKLIQQFEDGTIVLKTEEPKFWIKQLRAAKNRNTSAEIPPVELIGYLEDIENLLLETPFQFGDNLIEDALNILTGQIKTELESLLVQLLTAELNVVSGRGSDSMDFDLALLAYGEAAAAELAAAGGASLQKAGSEEETAISIASHTTTSDAEMLLTAFNFSGGGGGVGGNQ